MGEDRQLSTRSEELEALYNGPLTRLAAAIARHLTEGMNEKMVHCHRPSTEYPVSDAGA